jgi:hypothetical protein
MIDPDAVNDVQRLRGFDSEWFDQMHAIHSAQLLHEHSAAEAQGK